MVGADSALMAEGAKKMEPDDSSHSGKIEFQ